MFRQGNMIHELSAVMLVFVICLFAAVSCSTQQPDAGALMANPPGDGIIDAANEVLNALEKQDGRRLASLVHPEKGVRFSSSAYVDIEVDLIFSRDQIEHFWTNRSVYQWGYEDGTGDPIILTPAQYWRKYILTRDFRQISSINVNDDQASGNTVNNSATVYPNATRVEYYIKPSSRDSVAQLDWAALRLVFERVDGLWFLVGVIHDQWSV